MIREGKRLRHDPTTPLLDYCLQQIKLIPNLPYGKNIPKVDINKRI